MAKKDSLELPKYIHMTAGEGENACTKDIPLDEGEIKQWLEWGWRVERTYPKPLTDKQAAEAAEYGHGIRVSSGNLFVAPLRLKPNTPKKEALAQIRKYRQDWQSFGKLNFSIETECRLIEGTKARHVLVDHFDLCSCARGDRAQEVKAA